MNLICDSIANGDIAKQHELFDMFPNPYDVIEDPDDRDQKKKFFRMICDTGSKLFKENP